MAKKLDINVSKEGIERNFKLLNAALTEYDKKLAQLVGGLDEQTIKRLIAEREKLIREWVLALLAKIGFNLDDYKCEFANITAEDYIDFRVVNDDEDREYTLRWSHGGIRLLGHDGSEAETVTGRLDFASGEFDLRYADDPPFVVGRTDYDFSQWRTAQDSAIVEGGTFDGLQLGQIDIPAVYDIQMFRNCTFTNCDFAGCNNFPYLNYCTFMNCDFRELNTHNIEYQGVKLTNIVYPFYEEDEHKYKAGDIVVYSSSYYVVMRDDPGGTPGDSSGYVDLQEVYQNYPQIGLRSMTGNVFTRCNFKKAYLPYIEGSPKPL